MIERRQLGDEIIGGAEVPEELKWSRGRLDDWMVRMEGKLDKLATDMADVKFMRSQVEEHHARIYGNGQPGLIKDVDRLKQWRKSLYWLVGIFGTATVGDFISSFFARK